MKSKKRIIICVVLLLMLVISLGLFLKLTKKDNNKSITVSPPQNEYTHAENKNLRKLTKGSYYDTVEECVDKFFKFYCGIYEPESFNTLINYTNQEDIERVRDNNIEAVYNILDENYISFSNITEDNLQKELKEIYAKEVEIDDIYVCQKDLNISIYFVNGKLKEPESIDPAKFNIMVCLDMKNRNYSVFLEDYIKKYYPNIDIGKELSLDNIPNEITNKKYNNFVFKIN